MSEILALKGRLQAAKDKKRLLEAQAIVQLRAARDLLDPWLKPVTKLKDDQAAAAVGMLQSILASAREVDRDIADLEEALGQ